MFVVEDSSSNRPGIHWNRCNSSCLLPVCNAKHQTRLHAGIMIFRFHRGSAERMLLSTHAPHRSQNEKGLGFSRIAPQVAKQAYFSQFYRGPAGRMLLSTHAPHRPQNATTSKRSCCIHMQTLLLPPVAETCRKAMRPSNSRCEIHAPQT